MFLDNIQPQNGNVSMEVYYSPTGLLGRILVCLLFACLSVCSSVHNVSVFSNFLCCFEILT